MGEAAGPVKRWALRAGASAGAVITVGQLYMVQEIFFTRKEAEAEIRRVDRLERVLEEDFKEIRADIRGLKDEISVINRNSGTVIHELKKKLLSAEEKEATQARRAADEFYNREE